MAEVIRHWNQAWSRHLRVRLELLRWEDDAYPDIGEDAQDVINQQIPSDWDLFIGLMWSRFGTSTSRAGSGTQEEFDRALERYRSSPAHVSLLFYFKDAPIAPSKLDPSQLQSVQNFKLEVQSRGLLTWDFSETDQFEKLIDLHITKHVQEWRKAAISEINVPAHVPLDQGSYPAAVVTKASAPDTDVENDDDSGYLDLLEAFAESAAEIERSVLHLSAAQEVLTEHATEGHQELARLQADPDNTSTKKFRAAISRVADQMLHFSSCVDVEVPLLHAAFDGSMSALTRLVAVSADLYPQQVTETELAAISLLQHLSGARQATEGFRDSTAELPKMTKELVFAKRKQVAALNSLIAEYQYGEALLVEGIVVINGIATKMSTT